MTIPTSKSFESYPHGTDYEWYAIDAVGHVAVFTTAGIGPMPVVVLGDLPLTDSLMNVVQHLPARGRATMLVSLPRPDDFIEFASRGLFAYDWQDVHRTRGFSNRYEMLSRPDTPIHISELPEQFHPLLRSTALPGVRFTDSLTIDVREFLGCEPVAQHSAASTSRGPSRLPSQRPMAVVEFASLAAAGVTMSRVALYRCCLAVAVLGLVNGAVFLFALVVLHGAAISSKIVDGHYYFESHGRSTEVSKSAYEFSRWHCYSLMVTTPLCALSALGATYLCKRTSSNVNAS